jgi:hypothetical protein
VRFLAVASLVAVTAVAAAAWPAGAGAASRPRAAADEPGRWRLAAVDRLPGAYRQGVAVDGAGHAFWAGLPAGLYRSNVDLEPQLRLPDAVPSAIRAAEGWTMAGDPAWDPAGRLLLPLDCAAGSTAAACPSAGIAVFDAGLIWRHYAELDRAAIARIDWAELSDDRSLVWTSSGRDLLSFHGASFASEPPEPLRPVYRFAGVLPLAPVTGSAWMNGRLLLAGEQDGRLQVWSFDVNAARRELDTSFDREQAGRRLDARLELQRPWAGDPRGLAIFDGRGGVLHLIFAPGSGSPTFGGPGASLLSFVPAGDAVLEMSVARVTLRAGRPASIPVRVFHRFAGRTRPVPGVTVRAGRWRATTDDDGAADLRVRPLRRGSLRVTAAKRELTSASQRLPVVASLGGVLAGPPSMSVSGGAARRVLRAARLLDCSGEGGCEALDPPRPRGCVPLRGRAPLRIGLFRKPAREISVLLHGQGRNFLVGRARPAGREGLGWRLSLPGRLPARGRLELIVVYPDGTGAQLVTRTAAGRC